MKAKDVHAILKASLGNWFKSNGFVRFTSTASTWYSEGQQFRFVRIHLSKWGYTEPMGNEMLLRAWQSEWLSPQPHAGQPMGAKDLLPEPLLCRMKILSDIVTRKIIAGDWASIIQSNAPVHKPMFERMLANLKQSLKTPFVTGMFQDGMSYVDADDVFAWSGFLAEAMPHVAAKLSRF